MGRHLNLSNFKGIGAVVAWSDDSGATWHPTVFEDVEYARGFARSLDEKGRLVSVKRPVLVHLDDVVQGKESDDWVPASECWPYLGAPEGAI